MFELHHVNDVCAEFETRNINLLFSELIKNLSLRGGPMSTICDITTNLEANRSPVCDLHRCDVET